MADSPSVVGAVRQRILGDAGLAADLPGGIHVNELPSNKNQQYPAVVVRYPKTEYQWATLSTYGAGPARSWVEKPRLELWVECLAAEAGEAIARAVVDRLLDGPLELTFGDSVQVFPLDLFLSPEAGRNAAGERQYSWCVPFEVWVTRNQ